MTRGLMQPGERETLSQFLTRVLAARDTNVSRLSRELADADGKSPKTWERQLRTWRTPGARSLQRPNAAVLTGALNADFLPYASTPASPREMIGEVLDRLEAMEARLALLEARTPTP